MRTFQVPSAPLCAVHGVDCYLVEADIVNKRTKAFIHTHDTGEEKRYVCPSACEVCKAAREPEVA